MIIWNPPSKKSTTPFFLSDENKDELQTSISVRKKKTNSKCKEGIVLPLLIYQIPGIYCNCEKTISNGREANASLRTYLTYLIEPLLQIIYIQHILTHDQLIYTV